MSSPSATMAPDAARLPAVLPTDRLTATGMPVPELRAELRRIDNLRNAGSVALCWAHGALTVAGAILVADRVHPIVGYGLGIVFMGPVFARFAILGHEAAHKLLFDNKRYNDLVGKWLVAYPAFVPFAIYRRGHFAHHKEEFGPNEPDIAFYAGYPMSRSRLWRKLRRDAFGSSGWKNLKALIGALRSPTARPHALPIVGAQVGVAALFTAIGRPELYVVLWLVPWMTSWRVINRLRAIAEHGGMIASKDRRQTTHIIGQSRLANFWIVPFNTGWHLAHHVDMGVPWRRLPELHGELVRAGWVTDELTYPTYRDLWRALTSGPDESRI